MVAEPLSSDIQGLDLADGSLRHVPIMVLRNLVQGPLGSIRHFSYVSWERSLIPYLMRSHMLWDTEMAAIGFSVCYSRDHPYGIL